MTHEGAVTATRPRPKRVYLRRRPVDNCPRQRSTATVLVQPGGRPAMPRKDRGAARALAVFMGLCLLAGIAAVGGLGLAAIRAHLQAAGPPASLPAAAAAPTVAAQEAARVGSAAANLLSTAHPDPAAAVAAWQRFADAVANATTLASSE